MPNWYCDSLAYTNFVVPWTANTTVNINARVRQTTATYNTERVYVCIQAGTTGATEPAWGLTRGAVVNDGTAVWQECTGVGALNGDSADAPLWTPNTVIPIGRVIQSAAISGYFMICRYTGTTGATEPGWSGPYGQNYTDGTVTWVKLFEGATGKWTAPAARISHLLTIVAPGDTIYVGHTHAATTTSNIISFPSPGTAANPVSIICVQRFTGPFDISAFSIAPPTQLATTGSESQNRTGDFSFSGFAYVYGLTFSANASNSTTNISFNSNNPWAWTLENCVLSIPSTNTLSRINVGINSSSLDNAKLTLINCMLRFGSTSQLMSVNSTLEWLGGGLHPSSTVPTTLASTTIGVSQNILIRGVDLSPFGVSRNLFNVSLAAPHRIQVENCKLGSSVNLALGAVVGPGGTNLRVVNSDSAGTNYRYFRRDYTGSIFHGTNIYRVGGATDGTTPVCRSMISSANTKFFLPLTSDPIYLWNEVTGVEQSVVIEILSDGITLTDEDVWLEIEFLGSATHPRSSFASDRKLTILSTAVNKESSNATWVTTGISSPVTQRLRTNFTAAMAGFVSCVVCLARPSTTLYFCPKPEIS